MIHPVLEQGWVLAILPEIILCVGGMLLMLCGAFATKGGRGLLGPLALATLLTGVRILIGQDRSYT